MMRDPTRGPDPKRIRDTSGHGAADGRRPGPTRRPATLRRRRLGLDDTGVMQVIEAMLALSILVLAISWAVTVSQRPAEGPVQPDELRTLTRQTLELIDATNETGIDTVREFLEAGDCEDAGDLAKQIVQVIGDVRVNLYLTRGGDTEWVGSAFTDGPNIPQLSPPDDVALARGFHTSVVRYLTLADCDGDGPGESEIMSLRVEVWRS